MDVSQFDINQSIIIINQSVPTSSSSHRLLHQQQQPYHHFVVLHLLPTASSSSLIIHITWYSSALPSIFSSASSTHFISGRGARLTRGGNSSSTSQMDELLQCKTANVVHFRCVGASHVRERETHTEEAERPQWCNTEMMIMLFAHRNPPQNTSVVMMKMVALLSSRRDPEWWLPSGQSGKQTDIVLLFRCLCCWC